MNEAKHILLYDDHCPLCTFQMKMLEWVDWLDVARMVGISDPRAADCAPPSYFGGHPRPRSTCTLPFGTHDRVHTVACSLHYPRPGARILPQAIEIRPGPNTRSGPGRDKSTFVEASQAQNPS